MYGERASILSGAVRGRASHSRARAGVSVWAKQEGGDRKIFYINDQISAAPLQFMRLSCSTAPGTQGCSCQGAACPTNLTHLPPCRIPENSRNTRPHPQPLKPPFNPTKHKPPRTHLPFSCFLLTCGRLSKKSCGTTPLAHTSTQMFQKLPTPALAPMRANPGRGNHTRQHCCGADSAGERARCFSCSLPAATPHPHPPGRCP